MRRGTFLLATAAVTVLAVGGLVWAQDQHRPQPGAAGPAGSADPSTAKRSPDPTPGLPGAVRPDSFFTPRRLAPGQRPPQFVIVSFDGAGSHQKWDYWRRVADESHARLTGFLSGVYLVDGAHRTAYRGPGHRPGRNSLGYWFSPQDVRTLIGDLNLAWSKGYELGTHYNGHFCAGDPPGGGRWTTAQWNNELNQFFRFWRSYRTVDALPDAPALAVPADTVRGGRTPCLEGRPEQLMPALKAHGFSYDSSGIANGIAWPRTNSSGLWQFPLAYVPLAGRGSGVVSMDYNFWVKQTGSPPTVRDPVGDSAQVLRTYQGMYQAAYHGNRAPLVLGNHFNNWNGGAYTMALSAFMRQTCRKPDTYCLPYRDVIRWMKAQDPAVLADLQALPPVDGVGATPSGFLRPERTGPVDGPDVPAAGADETGRHSTDPATGHLLVGGPAAAGPPVNPPSGAVRPGRRQAATRPPRTPPAAAGSARETPPHAGRTGPVSSRGAPEPSG